MTALPEYGAERPYVPAFRVPPQAVEVEKHVIGALFLDPEAFGEVTDALTAQDFYLEKHATIFSAAQAVHLARIPVDMITVKAELEKRKLFNQAGGDSYLMEISSEVVSSANVVQHAGIIKEKAALRNVIGLATGLLEMAYAGSTEIPAVMDAFDSAAHRARAGSGINKGLRILSPEIWIPRALAHYDRKLTHGLSTGWNMFDQLYTVNPGETNLWTGMPGHGKSEFLDALMMYMADKYGWRIGYYSPENDQEDHVAKLAEKGIGKPLFGIGRMTRQEYSHTVENWAPDHFIWLDQQDEGCTFAQVLALAERVTPPLQALVVDPWNMLESDRPKGMLETDYILHCLRMARRFVNRTGISLHIVAHPAKMEPDKAGNLRAPTLYDISGSAHWFNAIDNGFTVFIDPETGEVKVIVQKVRKKRTGRTGCQAFEYDIPTGRYKQHGAPEFFRNGLKKKSKTEAKPQAYKAKPAPSQETERLPLPAESPAF